ncbi:sema domain-containing protein [Ditylenchus destructor]|uniref:Sema domain-containing protein n=1 Tax=Ditylenchus destructor TaxID=166010 RepID=A0AAD4QU14_9BILA|nr:sema domain-containing protein [Ditylenchus destructor]
MNATICQRIFVCLIIQMVSTAMGVENLNLKPRQLINEVDAQPRYRSPNKNQDLFKLLDVNADSVIIGARDAVYNLSATNLEPKYTIHWKALGQTIEECHMKGKSESECHNFIRVGAKLRNGRVLLCGTHAFSPQCREYDFSAEEDRFIEKEQYNGQAISPYDARHNSTYVYSDEQNEIFVGTVSDIGANDPLIYRKRLPRGDSLRTPKDDRVIADPHFVGSFLYKEYVYFWYREQAVESLDNNREAQTYARVGRVCASENGGPSPAQDRWSSFLKVRLNCSVPADSAPFYFNELQAISNPADDGKGDSLVYGVFHTSSSILMSAVCAFRMSQVISVFDHGRFKTQRTPTSLWGPYQKFYPTPSERPGRCVSDSSRLSDVSFIIKNPLMYDLVPSEGQRPLLVEGPGRPELTAIAVAPQVAAARKQNHDVIYLGRADGTVAKLIETSAGQSSVLIESVRVFEPATPILSLRVLSSSDKLIAISKDQVVQLPLHHCSAQQSCANCIRLRDPHCGWDVESRACVHSRDWSRASYVQNILKGVSEQCPGTLSSSFQDDSQSTMYIIDEDPNSANPGGFPPLVSRSEGQVVDRSGGDGGADQNALYSAGNVSLIALAVIMSTVGGFVVGYRICKWRIMNKLTRATHSAGSGSSNGSASDDYDHFGGAIARGRHLSRHDSLIAPSMLGAKSSMEAPHHIYSQTPTVIGGGGRSSASTGDAVSLVFGNQSQNHFVPLPMITSISNGGSGIATPRHEARTAMLLSNSGAGAIGATLPRDYKVKKVYL